ncbi:glycosyltransferase family 2 protein [Sphingobacterium sp.]|uniref:glycosyltransferase family 2 protein n=1 Tax=Sphingobacterium sp. TaxID=341027 RepID=UPI0028A06899|nr:glycosyltransferase family 2 protein [Sphingobacterium sp.]
MAFFSIIIPTFNSASTISDSIKSVLDQSFDDFEILIQDGCSTDNTLAIVKSFPDKRIICCSEKDSGVYDAMNKAIKRCEGNWLYFLGSDDTLRSNSVLKQVYEVLRFTNAKVVYGDVNIVGNNTHYRLNGNGLYRGETSINELFDENICHQAIFYNSTIFFEEQCLYDLKYPILADYMFNLSLAARQEFLYVPITIANYNVGGISSNISDTNFAEDKWEKIIVYFGTSLAKREFYQRKSLIRITGRSFIKKKEFGYAFKAFFIYVLLKLKM